MCEIQQIQRIVDYYMMTRWYLRRFCWLLPGSYMYGFVKPCSLTEPNALVFDVPFGTACAAPPAGCLTSNWRSTAANGPRVPWGESRRILCPIFKNINWGHDCEHAPINWPIAHWNVVRCCGPVKGDALKTP